MVRWQMAVVAVLASLMFGAPARGDEALDPGRIDPSLKGVPFGGSKDDVVRYLKTRITWHYDEQIRDTLDVRDRDRLVREKDAAIAALSSDFVSFDAKGGGWDVSVIRDEFLDGHGEEMLHLRDGDQHLYFFFVKGVFFKLVRSNAGRPLAEELTALEKAYGPAKHVEYHDKTRKDVAKGASWTEGLLTLQLDDRSRMFQCATVRWAVKTVDEQVKAEWAKARNDRGGLSPLIHESQQNATTREETDPVDDVLGTTEKPPAIRKPAPTKKK